MRKKIKLSFEALERELSQISSNQMLNILGGYMDPLPNGYCHFNMVSAMLYGSNMNASTVRDEIYEMYGRNSFTDRTWTDTEGNSHSGQSYNPDLLDGYMRSHGFNAHNVGNPSLSQIQNGLDANGGKVGVAFDGHAWTVEKINSEGQIVLKDSTNNGNPNRTVDASSISYAYFLSVPEGNTSNPESTFGPEEMTTPYEATTPYTAVTTPYVTTTYTD